MSNVIYLSRSKDTCAAILTPTETTHDRMFYVVREQTASVLADLLKVLNVLQAQQTATFPQEYPSENVYNFMDE